MIHDHVNAIILAGGSGTRLWPFSRALLPKHLLSLTGDRTFLQQTAARLMGAISPERIVTVTGEAHAFEVRRQLGEMDLRLAENVMVEPEARNTLPAISWAVSDIMRRDPAAVVGVFPSDHLILDERSFQGGLAEAVRVASSVSQGHLVTFGIVPKGPETGYGYIEAGATLDQSSARVAVAFFEKPDRARAEEYLRRGNFFWNSGMFVFKGEFFLSELRQFEPETALALKEIIPNSPESLKKAYRKMKAVSVDYGVMEKSRRVAVVPASFRWNDLGSWEAIYEISEKDGRGNVQQGNVLSLDSDSCLLYSNKGLLAAIGLKDTVVVQTDDAVLVSPRSRVQEVKAIVERLKEAKSPLAETNTTVHRPWGCFTVLEEGPSYKVKRIRVYPGQKLSLQSHRHRAEHWVVVLGTAQVTKGHSVTVLHQNESTYIPMGEKHRLENDGTEPLEIIEVQTGSYVGEDDIERFEDVYGRELKN